MLSKKIRLTTALFDQVFKIGKVQHGHSFWMRSFSLPAGLPSRFAVAVPKKVAKTAVLRNRIKRLVYRAIKCHIDDVSIKQNGSMVIFGVKSDISKVSFEEIAQEIKSLLLSRSRGSIIVE